MELHFYEGDLENEMMIGSTRLGLDKVKPKVGFKSPCSYLHGAVILVQQVLILMIFSMKKWWTTPCLPIAVHHSEIFLPFEIFCGTPPSWRVAHVILMSAPVLLGLIWGLN